MMGDLMAQTQEARRLIGNTLARASSAVDHAAAAAAVQPEKALKAGREAPRHPRAGAGSPRARSPGEKLPRR